MSSPRVKDYKSAKRDMDEFLKTYVEEKRKADKGSWFFGYRERQRISLVDEFSAEYKRSEEEAPASDEPNHTTTDWLVMSMKKLVDTFEKKYDKSEFPRKVEDFILKCAGLDERYVTNERERLEKEGQFKQPMGSDATPFTPEEKMNTARTFLVRELCNAAKTGELQREVDALGQDLEKKAVRSEEGVMLARLGVLRPSTSTTHTSDAEHAPSGRRPSQSSSGSE